MIPSALPNIYFKSLRNVWLSKNGSITVWGGGGYIISLRVPGRALGFHRRDSRGDWHLYRRPSADDRRGFPKPGRCIKHNRQGVFPVGITQSCGNPSFQLSDILFFFLSLPCFFYYYYITKQPFHFIPLSHSLSFLIILWLFPTRLHFFSFIFVSTIVYCFILVRFFLLLSTHANTYVSALPGYVVLFVFIFPLPLRFFQYLIHAFIILLSCHFIFWLFPLHFHIPFQFVSGCPRGPALKDVTRVYDERHNHRRPTISYFFPI